MAKQTFSAEVDMDISKPIKVEVSIFKGVLRMDIRHYYINDEGDLRPTKSGINFPYVYLEDLLYTLSEAQEAVDLEEEV